MGILDQEAVAGFLRMCDDGWLQGWHERNGGNLTCRLLPGEVERCRPWLHAPLRRAELGVEAPELAGEYFLTTGSGKYFRNVRRAPLENIGIVRIDGSGSAYEIVWGLEGDARPTSEFASHILNHRVRREVTRGRDRVIYHAHTPALIAMTYILPLTDRDFTRILWKSATECPVVFPAGVGVVDWMVPGGPEIARATSGKMARYDAVVWAHHGLFCAGPAYDSAFGLMHTIEKAADVFMRVQGSGLALRQTITDDGLREIAQAFGVCLNMDFLD